MRLVLLLVGGGGLVLMEWGIIEEVVGFGLFTALTSLWAVAFLLFVADTPQLPPALEGLFPVRGRWLPRLFAGSVMLFVILWVIPHGMERMEAARYWWVGAINF